MTSTIRRVARPKGELSDEMAADLINAQAMRNSADTAFRSKVIEALFAGGSFREVSRITGLSVDTLQRWKREWQDATA